MSEMAIKICDLNTKDLIKELNAAFAEEWLAYYQYWIGAQVAAGAMRSVVSAEFEEHAKEELEHAEKIAKRIAELGGTPLTHPNQWEKAATCKYEEPKDPCTAKLLEQNLSAERCAIVRYQKICEMTHGKDFVTFDLALSILKDEIEHEQEIDDLICSIWAKCAKK